MNMLLLGVPTGKNPLELDPATREALLSALDIYLSICLPGIVSSTHY
jgi:hypothetical protein